jgi:hypothetical protein
MLNKGAHILKAVQVLDDILRRMQSHQVKKTAMLRRLHVAAANRPQGPRRASHDLDPSSSLAPSGEAQQISGSLAAAAASAGTPAVMHLTSKNRDR